MPKAWSQPWPARLDLRGTMSAPRHPAGRRSSAQAFAVSRPRDHLPRKGGGVMSKLGGQVAIVTGASSGVGWQVATRLSEQGVRLCVTARRQEALEQLKR